MSNYYIQIYILYKIYENITGSVKINIRIIIIILIIIIIIIIIIIFPGCFSCSQKIYIMEGIYYQKKKKKGKEEEEKKLLHIRN